MLRTELKTAVNNVLITMEKIDLVALIESLLGHGEKQVEKGHPLAVFREYLKIYEKFGNAEKEILEILQLCFLNDVQLWTMLVREEEVGQQSAVSELYGSLKFAQDHLPKLLALLKRDTDDISERLDSKAEGEQKRAVLTTIVIEERDLSTPERLILLFQSIEGLYGAAAQVLNGEASGLSVVSCDSGSDKSFDFLGVAKIMQCVKEIILSFWDRVVYFREDKTDRRLELIANSLPIIEQITNMHTNGQLEPERAELLKRQVIESINKFAKAGVTIPEIEKYTKFNPRQLMKPERKLLGAPREEPGKKAEQPPEKAKELPHEIDDPEFQKYMEKMASDFHRRHKEQQTKTADKESRGNSEGSEA